MLLNALEWYGAVSGAIAALIVSLNLGTRPTGWAFVIFVSSSISLLIWGFANDEGRGIGVQNAILLIINLIGVWRYLFAKSGRQGLEDNEDLFNRTYE